MQVKITITADDAKKIIAAYLARTLVSAVDSNCITFETKSKHNYKPEWEDADFRVTYSGSVE